MKAFKIKSIILCIIFFLFKGTAIAQLVSFVTPGQSPSTRDVLCTGCWAIGAWNWSLDCADASILINNQNAITMFIPINTNCCNVTAHYNGWGEDALGVPFFESGDLLSNILPVINPGPSVVFPGDIFVIGTSAGGSSSSSSQVSNYPACVAIGGLNCASTHGCPNANITWTVSGASGNPLGGGSCIDITVPTNPGSVTSPIVINANYNCNGVQALGPVSINVALHSPAITGSQSIGCGGNQSYVNNISNNTVVYHASTVAGAYSWVWTWPPGMTPTNPGNVHGQSISLDIISSSGSGTVTVQAFSQDGSVSSGVVSYPVNICCVPVINDNTTLNSGNTGYHKEASSTINSTNDIQSTATGTLHAGVEVRLLPGFNAIQGSQVHLYNAACNTGFMRMQSMETTVDSLASSGYVTNPNSAILNSSTTTSPNISEQNALSGSNVNFNVMPNPSSGKFTISLNRSKFPMEISVIDGFGRNIQKIEQIHENSITVDLGDYADGIYVIRATFTDRVESKSLIKYSK